MYKSICYFKTIVNEKRFFPVLKKDASTYSDNNSFILYRSGWIKEVLKMFSWFIAICTLFFIGIGLGGLFVTKKMFPHKLVFFGVALLFGFAGYVGMVTGTFLPQWVSGRLMEILAALVALVLVVLCITRFHPTLGYFHSQDKGIWTVLIALFFLLGNEWALYEMSRTFILFAIPLFFVFVIGGASFQLHISKKMWRETYFAFLPLLWLIFIAIIKMF